jgi:N-acyl-D-amino-acid deacylase
MGEMELIMKLALLFSFVVVAVHAADFDIIIKNAQIADGTGAPLLSGSIGIKDKRIVAVGEVKGSAATEIDAQSRIVAPGFIDVHTHSEDIVKFPQAENFVRMGVTTIITGNCGHSHLDVAKFFKDLDETGNAINVATLVGHGSVREKAMGGSFIRVPTAEQLETMKSIIEQAMKDGAVGMSTGLIYVPGTFAKTPEIVECAKVVARYDGTYASHIRYETTKVFTAMEELLTIAREAKVRTEYSHIKLSGPAAWGMTDKVIAQLDKARAEGLQVTHDQYVYTASSTGLGQTIPDSALEGTAKDFAARMDDPAKKAGIIEKMKDTLHKSKRSDFSYVVIARCNSYRELSGKNVKEAAKLKRGNDSLEDQIELILDIQRQGGASAIFHGMNEDDLRAFLVQPLTMIASDGGPHDLKGTITHPRSFGNNARVLGEYVREKKILTLPDAIRKMTSLPANTFKLTDRGVIKPGAWADIVIFDEAKVKDTSTFDDPLHYSEGFTDVLVRGTPVLRDGKMTDARPGGSLRK